MRGWCLFRPNSALSQLSSCGSIFTPSVFYYILVFLSLCIQSLAHWKGFYWRWQCFCVAPHHLFIPLSNFTELFPLPGDIPSGCITFWRGGGCCWSLHRQMHPQHHGSEKHSGIFSDHEWPHLWFFSASKCLQGPACSNLAQEWLTGQYSSLLQHPRLFPPLFAALVLPAVCVRGSNQNSPGFTGLCFTSAGFPVGFIQLLVWFFFWLFFAMLMEAASWNYHELPLSNDLLVKPTITAVSRPSEHS